ncbi:O-antigen ligase family protein [Pirellulaceae bacterium SH449]
MIQQGDFSSSSSNIIAMLPRLMLLVLVGVYLVAAQWNPCDSTSVAAGASLNLIVIGIAIGILTPLVSLLEKKRVPIPLFPTIALILFALWLAISTYMVRDNTNLRVAMLGLWQTVAILGVLHGLVAVFSCSQLHNKVLHVSIALAIGSSMYALYQYFISMPQTRAQFLLSKEEMLQKVGITSGSAEAMQFENRLFSTEPIGPFALTNSLAGVLAPVVVLIGIIVWSMFWRKRVNQASSGNASVGVGTLLIEPDEVEEATKKYIIPIGIVLLALTGFVLVLTKSRTAWVATAAGILFGSLLLVRLLSRASNRWIFLGLAACLGMGFVGAFAIYWVDSGILTEASKSLLYRIEYWQGAWQLSLRSPWFGYGPLAFQAEYVTVKALTASENPADPHNMWMEILVWGGYPLLGLALAGALWLASSVVRSWRVLGRGIGMAIPYDGFAKVCESSDTRTRSEGDYAGSIAIEIGAGIALLAVLFFGLIVYSVDPQSDLLFNAVAFGGGTGVCYWFVRKINLRTMGLWIASVLIVLVVAIHFLFSGGWMQPGAMSPLVIGLAGMLVFGTDDRSRTSIPTDAKNLSQFGVSGLHLVLWGGAVLAFGLTTMGPERERGRIEQLHREQQLLRLPQEDYSKILLASTGDPDQASWLMQAAHQQLLDPRLGPSSRRQWLEVYEQTRRAWISRDPRNWLVYHQIAILDSMAWEVLRSQGIEVAEIINPQEILVEASRAAGLNPTSAQCQLQLAVLAFWAGSLAQAENALAAAERIDQATPHSDRKLAACSVWVPRELVQGNEAEFRVGGEAGTPGYFKGEPVFSWLRKLTQ